MAESSNESKSCRVCKETKEKTAFDTNRKICKECRSIINSMYYKNNKEKWNTKSKSSQ